jgi:hypothetical protein
VTNLKAKELISRLSVTGSGKIFLFQNLQAGFGTLPSSYLMGAEEHTCAAEEANNRIRKSCNTNNFTTCISQEIF